MRLAVLSNHSSIMAQAQAEALDIAKLENLSRYDIFFGSKAGAHLINASQAASSKNRSRSPTLSKIRFAKLLGKIRQRKSLNDLGQRGEVYGRTGEWLMVQMD